jgi:phosphoribosyl-AMP cyclohydrolase
LKDPQLVRCAVEAFGDRIAVGIDAVNGMVAAEGWLEISNVPYIQMAQQMEKIGVKTLIFTDISKDGTLEGPNFVQLSALTKAVSCNIIASGGIRDLSHICKLADSDIYGAICGKSLYSRTLHLDSAIVAADLNQLFKDSPLIPAIIQENETGEVLMLAYMNRESIKRTLDSGTTWFWSRSRQEYWNKGATSGHYQHVVSITADCDDDALLIRVKQDGAACHTGSYSCFFKNITPQN